MIMRRLTSACAHSRATGGSWTGISFLLSAISDWTSLLPATSIPSSPIGLRRGLSEQTVLHHHRLIFQALRWGVRMGTLARNVAEAVEPPRPKQYQARTLGWEEVYKFLQVAQPSGYYALFLIAILTGIRTLRVVGIKVAGPGHGSRNPSG